MSIEDVTTVSSILNQIGVDPPTSKLDPGVANFARIPLTKFTMKDAQEQQQETTEKVEEKLEEDPEPVTFAPNAVTVSAINNEGFTRILEVVKINRTPSSSDSIVSESTRIDLDNDDDDDDEPKETIEAVNDNGATRLLEVIQIKGSSSTEPTTKIDIEEEVIEEKPKAE